MSWNTPDMVRGTRRYGPGVFQLNVVPGIGKQEYRMDGTVRKGAPMDGGLAQSAQTDEGYRVEIALPSELLEYEGMKVSARFNFDLGINDADGAGRESQLMWSGGRNNWSDARRFGRMVPEG